MTTGAIALQHAVAITKNFDAIVAGKAATFRIGNALIGLQCSLFCPRGQQDTLLSIQITRMEQIQIRRIKSQ
ncbi:Uncharacterised protein [Yersinia enterocolitica]|nr:Uncharacterised protein [Yersinia enterocolitica]